MFINILLQKIVKDWYWILHVKKKKKILHWFVELIIFFFISPKLKNTCLYNNKMNEITKIIELKNNSRCDQLKFNLESILYYYSKRKALNVIELMNLFSKFENQLNKWFILMWYLIIYWNKYWLCNVYYWTFKVHNISQYLAYRLPSSSFPFQEVLS